MSMYPIRKTYRADNKILELKVRLHEEDSEKIGDNIMTHSESVFDKIKGFGLPKVLKSLVKNYGGYDVLLGKFDGEMKPLGFYTSKDLPNFSDLPKAENYIIQKLDVFLKDWRYVDENNNDVTNLWSPKDPIVVGSWIKINP